MLSRMFCKGSAIAINSGEFLTVTPARTQVKAVGSKLIFTCTLVRPQLPDTTTTTGTPLTQLVFMQWKGPDSNYVTSQKGRCVIWRLSDWLTDWTVCLNWIDWLIGSIELLGQSITICYKPYNCLVTSLSFRMNNAIDSIESDSYFRPRVSKSSNISNISEDDCKFISGSTLAFAFDYSLLIFIECEHALILNLEC